MRATTVIALALLLSAPAYGGDDSPKPPVAPPAAPAPAAPAPAAKPAEKPLTPEQAADAVLAAVKAKDAAALKALAAKDDPDPWLVADGLIARSEIDAAEAFAKAAPHRDVERLPEFVASRRGRPNDATARAALEAANDALGSRDFARAIAILAVPTPGDDPIAAIRVEHVRGLALRATKKFAQSAASFLPAGRRAKEIGWLARAESALHEAGKSATMRSDWSGALAAWQERLPVAEARGDRAGLALTIGNIGGVHQMVGDYPQALEYHARALKMKEELGDRAGMALTLRNLGTVHRKLGNYSTALPYYERALKMSEESGDLAEVAGVYGGIGNVQWSLGNYQAALENYERALKIGDESGDRAGVARMLGNIGGVHFSLGNYPRALEVFERALKMDEESGDRRDVAITLGNIGGVHEALGNYPKALEAHELALRMKEEVGDRAGVALTLGNIGSTHDALGEHAKALEFHERALKRKQEVGDRAGAAATLNNIGNSYEALGDCPKALEFQERALMMSQELGDRAGVATRLGSIGNTHRSLGNSRKALEYFERALEMKEDLGDRADAAKILGSIGEVHLSLGNFPKALESFERVLQRMEEIGAREFDLRARWGIARVELALGDQAQAVLRARQAVEGLSLLASGLSDEQGAGVREKFSGVYGTGARAAARLEAAGDVSYFLESGRAGALLESLRGRDALRGAALPEGLQIAEAEARGKEVLAVTAYRRSLGVEDRARVRTLRAEMRTAQDGIREAVARIQREAKAAANVLYPKADTLEEIQKRLGAGEALISYGLFPDEPLAMVVTAKATRIARLAPEKEIEAAVGALEAGDRDSETAVPLAALRKAVWEPLALEQDVKRVLVSPDGALSYVPFALLVPDREVVYVPSGTTYGLLLDDDKARGEGVLALGDPDYQTKVDERATAIYHRGGAGRLSRLPATADEAKAVGGTVLLGKDATEKGMRDAVAKKPRWRAVHLACHGLIDAERPAFSSLALTADSEDDGFLTVLEVFRSKIPADLVVLSACETAKGKVVKGEGIMGLTRAFMFAGAPRVICSLWKVDDDATRALMTEFYRLWNPKDGKAGLPTAEALRKAQEFVRSQERWKHPYYWAAWVLWGLPS